MVWPNNDGSGEGRIDSNSPSSVVSPSGSFNSKTATNSQLLSQLSTMEADHLNQLHEMRSQLDEKDVAHRDELTRRIRERDAQLATLKEERGGCMRQIADLKNQLYQLQFEVEETTSDKADAVSEHQAKLADFQRELLDAKRALDDALQSQAGATQKATDLEREKNDLKKKLQANEGSKDSELYRLQQQLNELRGTNASLSGQIAEEKANTAKNNQLNAKEVSNLRSMLKSRDEAIQSLQGRVEKGQEDMTALEAELDGLKKGEEGWDDAVEKMRREKEEMAKLVEEKTTALTEMTANLDTQKSDYEEYRSLAEERGEEIERLSSQLKKEKESLQTQDQNNHSRVTTLEVQLQSTNESLNEAMEEIEDLQADVVFKEGRIASLEREIEEASSLLERRANGEEDGLEDTEEKKSTPPSSPRRESGNFARLRQEIERVTKDRARLESDHERQLSKLKTTKDGELSKLGRELSDVRTKLEAETKQVAALKTKLEETEKSKADLSTELEKTREVMDQLDAEEDRELLELQSANEGLRNEVQQLNATLGEKSKKEEGMGEELKEARSALIALDKERRSSPRKEERDDDDDDDDDDDEKMKALNEQLTACQERVRASESELTRTVREKEMVISDLRAELSSRERYAEDLKEELNALQLSLERGPSKRNYGMSIDPEWHEPDTISKLKVQVTTLTRENAMVERELRGKLEARDATIATLVLSAGNQEANMVELNAKIKSLEAASNGLRMGEEERKEVELLRNRSNDLTMELKQTKRKLSDVTEKLECAKQLSETDAMPDAQELAGRLVVSEQAQKVLKAENDEKLKERDAAIANLLCSLQANEGVISNLRMDVDNFKSKMNECAEESRRLQHENEIFASQIIDQDEEFETVNNRLREKTAEIASLKRDIANNSADVRNVKNFERQLDELREEKRYNVSRINKLEVELRDVDMRKAEDNGYELERVKLELRNAIDDRAATEERLNKQIESLRKLRNHAVEDFETKLHQRDSQIASLEKELLDLREKASSAEDDFDDIFLDADGKGQQESNKQLLEERDMLLAKIETLGEEIETLRATKDIDQVSELQSKLEQSERVREELEHDRSLFNSSKEREMDRLHRQLSEAREAQTAREMEQLSLLKKLESENDALRDEFCLQMKEKQAKIVALEQTLSAQEQVVGNMSNEMDQLQNGMEKVSIQRRAEIEEMTQELMDYTSKATRLEREVTALSMKLDEKKLKHKTEVAKLKDKISTLESETPLERIVRKDHTSNKHDDNRRREHELSEKNDHLKWLNNSLSDENKRLKERMESLKAKSAKKDGESPSPLKQSAKNNDKWRNVALQEQVAVLSQRVIELEENAAASSVAAAQSRRPPQSPRPSILHSPVIRSSLDKGSSARSSSAPKSALRVSTYDDSNQANDLLSNSDDEEVRNTNSRKNAGASTPPPSIPRPGEEGGGSNSTKHRSSEKSKGGSKSSSRFSLRKKSAPKFDDASNSTTNYDF